MLEKDREGLQGKIPSADACIKWGELWYSAQGVIFRQEEAFLFIWDSVPSQGSSLAVVLISFVRRSLGFCALWSERALVPVPPTALPALPGVSKQPGLRLSGSQEGTNSKQVSNYSKEVEGIGSGSGYVAILCWTLSNHNSLLHVRSWLCRVFLLRNQRWYLQKLTLHMLFLSVISCKT